MIHVAPVVLEGHGVRLEPLTVAHHDGLNEAAADGALWELWFTGVPAPGETEAYIAKALGEQAAGQRVPWVVREGRTGRIIGATSYHDIVAAKSTFFGLEKSAFNR